MDREIKGKYFGGRTSSHALILVLSRSGSTQDVAVLDGLPYKPEAKWLADQIRKAAEQQDQ